MGSTTVDNNSIPSSTQNTQFSFAGPKAGSTSPLASLATATEPNSFSSNQQQSSVATFPQRHSGGSPTANNGFSFGGSPPQASGSVPSFDFVNSSSTNASAQSFSNQPAGNVPRFSFGNGQSGNTQNFSFNQPTGNPQVQRPLGTFTFNQGASNNNNPQQTQTADQGIKSTGNTMTVFSKKNSDPPTPVSEQSSSFNQEQEETDVPASSAADSELAKKIHTKLHDPNTVVVDRSDPNSPLFSLTTFQQLNLHPDLLKGIFNMNFQSPSKIQAIALPNLLGEQPRNIIAQSQSGTGKTAAFSLAIISRINPSIQSPQALILAPTFELAIQIGSVIEKMAQFLPHIQLAYAVRDSEKLNKTSYVRGQLLPQPIVIGTPGTVEDWCYRKRVIDLSKLHICCVDEADVMIATEGFQATCVKIVQGLNKSNCQMMLFSATYNDEVMLFAREIVQNPVVLRLKREKQALTNINQYFINCYDQQQKYNAIVQIYASLTLGQTMIFCRTKATARDIAIRMANDGHSVRELTGALDIEQRAAVINNFREGVFRVLISTNVTSRGLDIEDVSLVVNYDMPVTTTYQPDFETYLHRIGRCGRFGKIGYTFNLIGSEKDFNIMKEIEAYFTHPIREITIEDIGNLENDQV